MEMLTKRYEFTPRTRKWVILLVLCGFSSYGIYKVYNLPSVSRKRNRFVKLLGALSVMIEMIYDSSETLGLVSRDLKEFLASDQDQIPNSLKQLSKIAVSDEFSKSLSGIFEAVTLGVIQGYYDGQKVKNLSSKDHVTEGYYDKQKVKNLSSKDHVIEGHYEEQKVENSSFKDHVIDKLMSKAGTGFVSVVVGSFARNLVLGFYSNGNYESDFKLATDFPQWVGVLSREKSKLFMGDLIKTFVSTAVTVYLDRGTSMNLYDGIFFGLTDHKYQQQVKDIVVHVCSGAVDTLIKTSHQVLTS